MSVELRGFHMTVRLYDSLSQSIQPLVPAAGEFRLYACGITPYDTTHLGHAFTYSSVDVLIRLLERQGTAVRYVQNVTDVDDDLLREAASRQEDWRRLGDQWTSRFIEDMTALNLRAPDVLPRASSVIPQMIDHIQRLLDRGVAYEAGGGVYFSIAAWPNYGSLSRLEPADMLPIANQRGNHPDDPNKRDPLDFVLWQPQAPGEPAWESRWSVGRPGWHLECSTMVQTFLGETIDLHVGGGDLIFPHHDSEIAQSEAANGVRFSRHWMHISMLMYQGEKMSKSLGNLVLVRDLLERASPDALRLYLAEHHYRVIWEHDSVALEHAIRRAERLTLAQAATGGSGPGLELPEAEAQFTAALEDDLDTPKAIGQLLNVADLILSAGAAGRSVEAAQRTLADLASLLGLRLGAGGPEPSVLDGWRRRLAEFNSS